MNYLRRKFDDFAEAWFAQSDRLPLIVKGARQVGKTASILHFAKSHYKNVVYVNFALQKKFLTVGNSGYEAKDIVKDLSFLDSSFHFVPGETLIVFDEIQDHPDVATSLKSFKIDGSYDVICSGSLLGIHYRKIHSIAVGYKTDYEMRSMDFEEFLWAVGRDGGFVEEIFSSMESVTPFSAAQMKALEAHFIDYCTVGGMPRAVELFARTERFEGVAEIQRDIINDYREDITKYHDALDALRIRAVFDRVAPELAKDYKRFRWASIRKGGRANEYLPCLEWLKDAGMVMACTSLHFPELPLKGNEDTEKFKLYIADSGLLVSMLDEESAEDFRANRNLGTYKGGLFENIVAEALVKAGKPLCYYRRDDSTLEMDFFLRTCLSLVPVEVKATDNRAKSLATLIGGDHYPDIRFGIKLHSGNIGVSNHIYSFPQFCAFLLPRFLKEHTFAEES